jgi:hypothetical protein
VPEHVTPGVYVEEISYRARTIEGVPTSVTAFAGRTGRGPVGEPVEVVSPAEVARTFGDGGGLVGAVRDFFAQGGRTALVLRLEGAPPSAADYADLDTGLPTLRTAGPVNLLCLPPDAPGGTVPDAVWAPALALCVELDALLLVDPPAGVAPTRLATWAGGCGLNGDLAGNAVLHAPRLRHDPPTAGEGDVVPCGAVAGVYARTDAAHGVWKAPANQPIAGLVPAVAISSREQDQLNPQGVNAIRAFPGRGTLVYGARTLQPAGEWKYVNVRRTLLFVERSLQKGLQWAVFEPNGPGLWAQVRQAAADFLLALWRDGALLGRTAGEAFFVRCDPGTMTQADLENGRLVVLIGVALLQPAEFVVVRIEQTTAAT